MRAKESIVDWLKSLDESNEEDEESKVTFRVEFEPREVAIEAKESIFDWSNSSKKSNEFELELTNDLLEGCATTSGLSDDFRVDWVLILNVFETFANDFRLTSDLIDDLTTTNDLTNEFRVDLILLKAIRLFASTSTFASVFAKSFLARVNKSFEDILSRKKAMISNKNDFFERVVDFFLWYFIDVSSYRCSKRWCSIIEKWDYVENLTYKNDSNRRESHLIV